MAEEYRERKEERDSWAKKKRDVRENGGGSTTYVFMCVCCACVSVLVCV